MNLIRCQNGHFYDEDRAATCPYCSEKRQPMSIFHSLFEKLGVDINNGWSTDYEGRCGNCHKSLQSSEKYCRYCGTKRGEGKFEPYQTIMQCIYGPMPVKRIRKCTRCQMEWETHEMVDNQNFCPECGAPSKIVFEESDRITPPASAVGRLVCVSGPAKGKDYLIYNGENTIGRGMQMDICIDSDPYISRINAAVIVFDVRNKRFFFAPSIGKNRVCVNGEVIQQPVAVKFHDILTVGESQLMLAPLD